MRYYARMLLVAALLGCCELGRATVIYSYSGKNFQTISDSQALPGSYATSMRVTGSFTVDAPLPANAAFGTLFVSPLSFSFSDGRDTFIDSTTPFLQSFIFSTGSAGEITAWQITLQDGNTNTLRGLGSTAHQIFTHNQGPGLQEDTATLERCINTFNPDGLCVFFGTIASDSGENSGSPGVWMFNASAVRSHQPGSSYLPGLGHWAYFGSVPRH